MRATALFPTGSSIEGNKVVGKEEHIRENRLEIIEETLLLMIQLPPL
jgi:hypothetical protein